MILTKSQAESVYLAICHLNNTRINVAGLTMEFFVDVDGETKRIQVFETSGGRIRISYGGGILSREREEHATLNEFFKHYFAS